MEQGVGSWRTRALIDSDQRFTKTGMAARKTTQALAEPGPESDLHDPPEFIGAVGDLELPRGHRRIAELVFRLFTEAQGPLKQATAVGIGVFIGCIPIFGIHLPLVLLVATLFRLSRLRMFAATWISNPVLAPFLVWSELQLGNLILTGDGIDHSLESVSEIGVVALGQALAIGSLMVGATLGLLAAGVVWKVIPKGPDGTRRRRVIEETAHRYLVLGVVPWFQVRRSLYRSRKIVELVVSGKLNPKRKLVDLECGRGEFIALLMEASPHGLQHSCVGVTSNLSCARQARVVLPPSVEIEVGQSRVRDLESADAVVIRRTKERDGPDISERLIKAVRASIDPSGVFLISWSKNTGPLEPERVGQWLESGGFVLEEQSVQKGWFQREHLILARVGEPRCDGN